MKNRTRGPAACLTDDGAAPCDTPGIVRAPAVVLAAPRDVATAFVSLLEQRGLVAFVPGRTVVDAVGSVRAIFEGQGRPATKAKKLAKLFDDAPWVDETFASEEVLEHLVEELS